MRIALVAALDEMNAVLAYTQQLAQALEAAGHEIIYADEEWQRPQALLPRPDVFHVSHTFALYADPALWESALETLRQVAPVVVTYCEWPQRREPVTRSRTPDQIVLTCAADYEQALAEGFFEEEAACIPPRPEAAACYLAVFAKAIAAYTRPQRKPRRLRLAVVPSMDIDTEYGVRSWLAITALRTHADVNLVVYGDGGLGECDGAVVFNRDDKRDLKVLAAMSEQGKPAVYSLEPGAIRAGAFVDRNLYLPNFRTDRGNRKLPWARLVHVDTQAQADLAEALYEVTPRWLVLPPGPEVLLPPVPRQDLKLVFAIGDVPGLDGWAKERGLQCRFCADEYSLLNEASSRGDAVALWERPSPFAERLLALAACGVPLAACRCETLEETAVAEWYSQQWQPAAEALLTWSPARSAAQVEAARAHTWDSWAKAVLQAIADEVG